MGQDVFDEDGVEDATCAIWDHEVAVKGSLFFDAARGGMFEAFVKAVVRKL
jgi:hypothetical protein